MKIINLFFCLMFIFIIGCKKGEIYSDNYYLESKNVVYGIIGFGKGDKAYSKKIINRDSLNQLIQNLNDSKYIGSCTDGKVQGVIALVIRDTSAIRLQIIDDNKIRIHSISKCYELNERYLPSIKAQIINSKN